jgi:glycerol-3-phosphate dehydrogenase (NAD(P)+)
MMKIGYLGAGTWGFCLSSILAANGHDVVLWTSNPEFAKLLSKKREHPKLPKHKIGPNVEFTSDMSKAITGVDLLVESVTSMGLRPVFEQVLAYGGVDCPIVVTSKGIEQNSGLLLPEVIVEVLGESKRKDIGCLSGPSLAEELIDNLPTSVVCSGYSTEIMQLIHKAFSTSFFRIYPNSDINGVAFGGALKNIIAIACGISDGLGFGDNTKAALMTRGLHEMRKLAATKGGNPETLNGLAGLGDLCVTCLSNLSRNYSFGKLIAQGLSLEEARGKIGMVVEGTYTCISALQLAKKFHVPVPITEAICAILYEGMGPRNAVKALLQRTIKEEHL